MKHRLVLGLLAIVALATMATPAPAADPAAIKSAIDRGVAALRRLQREDGTWPHEKIGATALAGLALVECGAAKDDDAVVRATDAVRKEAANGLADTYSISLSILFLDRLGDPDDVPLIESLVVRLLAGQDAKTGGWTYDCPRISAEEVRRLQGKMKGRKKEEGRREERKPGAKRKAEDLPPEIQEQLRRLGRGQMIADQQRKPVPGSPFPDGLAPRPLITNIPGDNSNTQFAALAIWVGRRHGLPVGTAIKRIDDRFRGTQLEDGGWQYVKIQFPPGMAAHMPAMRSEASMTCAGVLSLAIADGAVLEKLRENKPDAKAPDINQDKKLSLGLKALGEVIGDSKGLRPEQRNYHPDAPRENRVGGRTYYFLWSLERVAMALGLNTIGKKDWYGWGSEILLDNQQGDGSWSGDYAGGGVDTSFALLFLKRANFARDLTAHIKGNLKDPGERLLRAGSGLGKMRGKRMQSGVELQAKPLGKPASKTMNPESAELADRLLKATQNRQLDLLESMESGKGSKYTEALAAAIPNLKGDNQSKARDALARRLTRMKDETLAGYLQDDDAEIRRAAALAIGSKESKNKAMVPNLITLLNDPEIIVVRAAHAALKALTNEDFGPSAKATREEREQAVLKWVEWWTKQRKKTPGG